MGACHAAETAETRSVANPAEPPRAAPSWRRWTPGDEVNLEALWGTDTFKTIVAELGRSEDALRRRARKLRLPMVPEGWASVSRAAKHCGVDPQTLRSLMRRHGINRRRWYSCGRRWREGQSRGNYRGARIFVDVSRVAALLAEETRAWERVSSGAERHGVKPATLAAWLRQSHAEVRHTRGDRGPLVARTEDIDRVVAERGWAPGRVSLSAAARAVGLSGNTLRRRFQRAGEPVPKSNGTDIYLDLDAVRELVERTGGVATRRRRRSHGKEHVGRRERTYAPPVWCSKRTERVSSGAERHGVKPATLAAWLRQSHAEMRHTRGDRGPLVARTEDIDRVVAERGWAPGRVSLSAAARAVGLSLPNLRRRFRTVGEPLPRRKGIDLYLDLDAVREIVERTGGVSLRTLATTLATEPQHGSEAL